MELIQKVNSIKKEEIKKFYEQAKENMFNDDQLLIIENIINRCETINEINKTSSLLRNYVKTGLTFDVSPKFRSKDIITVLEKYPNLGFDGKDKTSPKHKLILGDNYDALNNLLITHRNRIDIIYIDPPYNTGGSNLGYKDKFGKDAWLNMMRERIILAKDLLNETGVIFVSLDDNMQAYFKIMMDEIFGENNFVGQYNWFKSATPPNLSKKIKKNIEYILCYEKQNTNKKFLGVKKSSSSDNGLLNQTNRFATLSFPENIVKTKLEDGIYKKGKYGTSSYEINLLEDTVVKNNIFTENVILEGKFKWSQNNLINEINKGTVISIKTKTFSPSYEKTNYDIGAPENFISQKVGVATNEIAGKELKEIFDNERVFDYPKPVSLVKYLINFIDNKNAIILDFFAGTGTTGHATLELNREDGGNRTFILNNLEIDNGNNIGIDICYERLLRISKGVGTNKEKDFKWIQQNQPYQNSLDVYRLKDLSINITNENALNEIDYKIYNDFNQYINITKENAPSTLINLLNHIGEK